MNSRPGKKSPERESGKERTKLRKLNGISYASIASTNHRPSSSKR